MATNPTPEVQSEIPTLAKKVVEDYTSWRDYSAPYRARWLGYWMLWNNQRIKRGYSSKVADSFDPMTFQMVEARVDNIYGSRPKLSFIPTIPEQEDDTKMIASMWDFSWDKADMDLHIVGIGREQEITGNTVIFTGWADGYMTMTHVPLNDVILDASASTPAKMRYAGYRRLELLDDLKTAKRFDPESEKWVDRYTNLSKVKTWSQGSGSGSDQLDAQQKDYIYAGSTLPPSQRDKQVEILYMCYKDKIVEVANREVVVAEYDNPFHMPARKVQVQAKDEDGEHLFDDGSLPPGLTLNPDGTIMLPNGESITQKQLAEALPPQMIEVEIPEIEPFLPVAMGRGFVDPSILLAKGTVEPFAANQEDLNDELNIKKDNLIYRQQNVGFVDSGQAGSLIPKLAQATPGALIAADGIALGHSPIQWMEKPELTQDTDMEVSRLKQSIRDTAGVDAVVQGIASQNNRTATEINAQVAGASSSFTTATRNLESGLYKQLGEQFWKMVQIFMTEEQMIRTIGRDGVEFKKFDPNKHFGVYDVKVVLESAAKAKAKEDADRLMAAFKMFAGDPAVNQTELKKLIAERVFEMDEDDLKLILTPDPATQGPQGMPPMPGDPAAMGQPMPGAPMPQPMPNMPMQ